MKTRRHHNTKGTRQIKRGKTRTQVKHIAKRLKIPDSQVTESVVHNVPDHPVAATCTIMYCQHFNLSREINELEDTLKRLDTILSRTANALKGEPAPLHLHSFHDLPEVAAKLRFALQVIYTTARTDEHGECWTIRKFLNEHDVYNENLQSHDRLIEEVCKLILKSG